MSPRTLRTPLDGVGLSIELRCRNQCGMAGRPLARDVSDRSALGLRAIAWWNRSTSPLAGDR